MNLMVNNLLGINSQAKNRFLFMDLWRILAIVNMLIYQICYTIYILQGTRSFLAGESVGTIMAEIYCCFFYYFIRDGFIFGKK